MARTARVESESGFYHVIMRGNNKNQIFVTEELKELFLRYLNDYEEEKLINLVAWCVMDNHVHLVLKAELANMSQALKRTAIKYVKVYHHLKNSVGHVFQDRYKSEPILTDEYLMRVIRYIHNNPVKANMVDKASEYKWSSYNTYLDESVVSSNEQMQFVIKYFNNDMNFFIKFHHERDSNTYLEVKEDLEIYCNNNAKKIITECCTKYGIYSENQLKNNRQAIAELVNRLKYECKLSLRKISRLINVPYSTVQRILFGSKKTVPNDSN